ncbi:MAG: hypothetical protein FWE67_02350 [Planctomycetaceae bacterium]|nr:hypothetical protein [Planctomycetaceae bacterium]
MSETLFSIPKDLLAKLHNANSEATVRQLVMQQLDCDEITLEEGRTDVYHKNVLFEFKHDVDLSQPGGDRAKVLAQALYYCNALYVDGRIQADGTGRVPPYIVLIDKDEFVFYERQAVEHIYKQNELFRQGIASAPDNAVIELCKKVAPLNYIFTSTQELLEKALRQLRSMLTTETMIMEDVTEYSFDAVYSHWGNVFSQLLSKNAMGQERYVCVQDCHEKGKIVLIESDLIGKETINVHFTVDDELMMIQRCPKSEYEGFWRNWKRIKDDKIVNAILKKIYDTVDMEARRKKGQFYTPTELARHGWAYLEKELGKEFWLDGTWRIWDCSCGEGGLAIDVIPRSALQYTYLSSLDSGEVHHVRQMLPMCKKVWKMDFLNTHVINFPEEVLRDMANEQIKWLFFINPPYGEGSSGKATYDTKWYKKNVSVSNVKDQMKGHNLSIESKEKYAQFLFRIEKEFKCKYVLGCYTTMKAFVSKEYANLRKFWRPVFKRGLICCANKWHQGNGNFPSVFSVFDCRTKGRWGKMEYDILEYRKGYAKGVFKGKKSFVQEDPKRSFRQYFFPKEGLPCDELTVVQANGLKTYGGKSTMSNYRPKGTWASAGFISAFMRQQNFSRMVSGNVIDNYVPIFINKRNYKKVLCGLGLYWSIKPTWKNNADFLSALSRNLKQSEEADAILYALVSTRNRTTTARLEETIITTKKGRTINGGIIVENKLNLFNTKLFDWSDCSDIGKDVLRLYKHYLDNTVKWKEQDTVLGKGEWLGLYQYHRIVPIPKELVNAIEKLRQAVEQIALEVCF